MKKLADADADADDVEITTLIQKQSEEFPTLMETLAHERDRSVFCSYTPSMHLIVEILPMISMLIFFFLFCFAVRYMSSGLLKITGEHSSVVAVLGKANINGIEMQWKQPVLVSFITPSRAS